MAELTRRQMVDLIGRRWSRGARPACLVAGVGRKVPGDMTPGELSAVMAHLPQGEPYILHLEHILQHVLIQVKRDGYISRYIRGTVGDVKMPSNVTP
ncbi:MAG: hypothetical protein WC683_06895 [bacterium]